MHCWCWWLQGGSSLPSGTRCFHIWKSCVHYIGYIYHQKGDKCHQREWNAWTFYPWATAKLATQLPLRKVEVKEQLWGDVSTKPIDLLNLNEILRTKEKEEIEPFSTWIIHGRLRLRLMGHKMHVMTTALAGGKGTTPTGPECLYWLEGWQQQCLSGHQEHYWKSCHLEQRCSLC